MGGTSRRALVVTVAVVILATAVLAISGIYLQRYISHAYQKTDAIRVARTSAFNSIKNQLDEETGLRGYVATHETLFLEPYYQGVSAITVSLGTLRRSLQGLGLTATLADADDAIRTNREWHRTVAVPLLHDTTNSAPVERRGKQLVDHYRVDIGRINRALDDLVMEVDDDTSGAINRVGEFVGATIVLIALFTMTYFVQQGRLAKRLELARIRNEDQRRRTIELRASYEAEKRIADTLQEAFSQRPLPNLPMLRFSATYVPATEETKVGGDWYDALELPQGRVLFAIGDVAGHGIEAAVMMNRVRQSLISCALLDPEPASVLRRVNGELVRNTPMVTALAGYADATTYEFVYASAGHPPPVLLEPGRRPRMLEFGSLPLGVSPAATYRTNRVQSVPGAMLVLYTDGALEHSRDVIAGEELLLKATAEAGDRTEEDAATVIHNAIFAGRSVGDDVAILTIGFSATPAHGLTISADNAQASFAGRVGGTAPVTPLGPKRDQRLRIPAALPKELAS